MKYISFKVNNMAITRASSGDKSSPVSGSVNYFGVEFEFDEEFSALAGAKSVEFFKKRNTVRKELIDGKCLIPNEMLKDKDSFDMRVINGNSVATPWVSVAVSESGAIMPDDPTEEAPENMEFVKTQSGDASLPYMRMGKNGPEFSQDGNDWQSGVSGVPDVPLNKKDKNKTYVRKNGDWVPLESELAEYAKIETIDVGAMAGGEAITDEAVIAQLNALYADYAAENRRIVRIAAGDVTFFPVVVFNSSGNMTLAYTRIQNAYDSQGWISISTWSVRGSASGSWTKVYEQSDIDVTVHTPA